MRHAGTKYIGEPWTICDGCGWKMRKSQVRKTWDGYMMCDKDWYEKHAQLLPIPKFPNEGKLLPDARPERADAYWTDQQVTDRISGSGL